MSVKKKNKPVDTRKAGRYFLQGRIFSLDFFKRNAKYIVLLVVMALAYIANKFECQRSIQELLSLKTDLADAQTDLVTSSANYNSMILESEMSKRMQQQHMGLGTPHEPPYILKSE